MRELRLASQAEDDLTAIFTFIADDNADAAHSVLSRIEQSFDRIVRNPEIGRRRPEMGDSVRSITIDSYVVFYHPLPEEILILRVMHGARDVPDNL